jgi:exosortase/archaeosortase family protein
MRAALLVAAAPLAILANALRVAGAAAYPALATGWLHMLSGWILFVLCLAGLGLVHWVLKRVRGRTHA